MEKKRYQKPMIEKVNLRVTESVLTACKTSSSANQPGKTGVVCAVGQGNACSGTQGS